MHPFFLGSTSDSYIDIGGSICDLGFMLMLNGETVPAEKQLKRALLMVDRSYRPDKHLRLSILCNLAILYSKTVLFWSYTILDLKNAVFIHANCCGCFLITRGVIRKLSRKVKRALNFYPSIWRQCVRGKDSGIESSLLNWFLYELLYVLEQTRW